MNKPSTFALRLRELLDIQNMTQAELSRKSGVSKSSITHYLKGDWEAKQDAVYSIASKTDVSEAWLMGYDVPMKRLADDDLYDINLTVAKNLLASLIEENPDLPSGARVEFLFDKLDYDPMIISYNLELDQSLVDNWINYGVLPPQPLVDKMLGLFLMKPSELLNKVELAAYHEEDKESEKAPLPPNIIPMPTTYKVPLIGTIACGKPILAVEEADEFVTVPDFIHADFALRCKGDSMINARIFDGDVVYIRRQPEVETGEIAAVLVGDEATLKRVTVFPDRIVLEPANPMYDHQTFRGEEMNQVEILGKAVGFTSMIR